MGGGGTAKGGVSWGWLRGVTLGGHRDAAKRSYPGPWCPGIGAGRKISWLSVPYPSPNRCRDPPIPVRHHLPGQIPLGYRPGVGCVTPCPAALPGMLPPWVPAAHPRRSARASPTRSRRSSAGSTREPRRSQPDASRQRRGPGWSRRTFLAHPGAWLPIPQGGAGSRLPTHCDTLSRPGAVPGPPRRPASFAYQSARRVPRSFGFPS